jgi:hypothetical protein
MRVPPICLKKKPTGEILVDIGVKGDPIIKLISSILSLPDLLFSEVFSPLVYIFSVLIDKRLVMEIETAPEQ